MIRMNRKNKLHKNRKFSVYKDSKKIGEVIRHQDWIYIDLGKHRDYIPTVRNLVMRDLYWLIGDDCDVTEWSKRIDRLDNGQIEFDVPILQIGRRFNSMFDNILQREIARASITNTFTSSITFLKK